MTRAEETMRLIDRQALRIIGLRRAVAAWRERAKEAEQHVQAMRDELREHARDVERYVQTMQDEIDDLAEQRDMWQAIATDSIIDGEDEVARLRAELAMLLAPHRVRR